MLFFIIAVPFIVSVAMLIFFRRKMAFWEYIVLFLVSFAITFFLRMIMKSANTSDVEYLGYYVTQTTRYEPWNERVRVRHTRTRTVPKTGGGTRTVTESYYVWETRNHPEKFTFTDNAGDEHLCAKALHIKIKNTLASESVFRDMHRHYYTKDGDAYDWKFDDKFEHIFPYTEEHYYKNPLKSSRSILAEYEKITDEIKEEYGLFEYPLVNKTEQKTVLGIQRPDTDYIDKVNALLGKEYQFRVFILCFEGKSIQSALYQKAYWQNGNKNELVLCLGLENGKVSWCEGFTWCDTPIVEAKCKQYFLSHPNLNFKEFSQWLIPVVKQDWVRKDFPDFDYVNTELSNWQYFWILLLVIIANGLCCYVFVTNSYDAPKEK